MIIERQTPVCKAFYFVLFAQGLLGCIGHRSHTMSLTDLKTEEDNQKTADVKSFIDAQANTMSLTGLTTEEVFTNILLEKKSAANAKSFTDAQARVQVDCTQAKLLGQSLPQCAACTADPGGSILPGFDLSNPVGASLAESCSVFDGKLWCSLYCQYAASSHLFKFNPEEFEWPDPTDYDESIFIESCSTCELQSEYCQELCKDEETYTSCCEKQWSQHVNEVDATKGLKELRVKDKESEGYRVEHYVQIKEVLLQKEKALVGVTWEDHKYKKALNAMCKAITTELKGETLPTVWGAAPPETKFPNLKSDQGGIQFNDIKARQDGSVVELSIAIGYESDASSVEAKLQAFQRNEITYGVYLDEKDKASKKLTEGILIKEAPQLLADLAKEVKGREDTLKPYLNS